MTLQLPLLETDELRLPTLPQEYRSSRFQFALLLGCALMFAIFIGVFEFLVPIELNAGRNDRFFQWLVRIVFAGLFFITAYGVADTAIRKLRVTSEGIESRTFLSTRLIHWCEIKRVNWCSIGGIRIESEQTHITIDPHSRPNELRWLLAVSIKRQAGNIVERNWQPFVRRHLGLPSIPIHELVVQTRRHWLRVFVPGLLAIWVVSVICHFSFPIESGKWLHGGIGASGFLILLWGMLIVATPKTGFRSSRRVEVSNAASAKMAFGFVLYPLALTLLTIFVPQGTTRDVIQVAIGCGVLGIILWMGAAHQMQLQPFIESQQKQAEEEWERRFQRLADG